MRKIVTALSCAVFLTLIGTQQLYAQAEELRNEGVGLYTDPSVAQQVSTFTINPRMVSCGVGTVEAGVPIGPFEMIMFSFKIKSYVVQSGNTGSITATGKMRSVTRIAGVVAEDVNHDFLAYAEDNQASRPQQTMSLDRPKRDIFETHFKTPFWQPGNPLCTPSNRVPGGCVFGGKLFLGDVSVDGEDDGDDGAEQLLYLAGKRITAVDTRIPGNDLDFSPPAGPLTVIEPDTTEATTAIWKSDPLPQAALLLPGNVTLDLLVKNYQENAIPEGADIFFSKRISVAGESPGSIVVATGSFENPFPAVGNGSCPPTFVLGQHPPAAGCAPQGLLPMTAPSLIVTPTPIPAGAVEELRIWCPGVSFIGAFFNGPFSSQFSTLREPKCLIEDDDDNDGLNNSNELLLGLLLNDTDSDDDGIVDGNDDSNGNGDDDEDEDDDDDACPDPDSDGDGEDDEDEDDDDGDGDGD